MGCLHSWILQDCDKSKSQFLEGSQPGDCADSGLMLPHPPGPRLSVKEVSGLSWSSGPRGRCEVPRTASRLWGDSQAMRAVGAILAISFCLAPAPQHLPERAYAVVWSSDCCDCQITWHLRSHKINVYIFIL